MAVARPRLLVLRALGLGDLLAAVPALRALARAHPDHERLLAAPAALAEVAAWTGAVDRVVDAAPPTIPTARGPFPPLTPLPAEAHRADVAVNLHGSGPQSHRVLLATRPGRLVSYAHPAVPAVAGPAWDPDEHERERWCRLVAAAWPAAEPNPDDVALHIPDGPLPGDVGDSVSEATVVHPGGARPAARWPADRFAAVAFAERTDGRRVLVTGGPDEVALAREVADRAGLTAEAVLAGRTDLSGLARLLRSAGRLVSADTGVAHLAVALGTPSVTVYGPASPARWGPPRDRPCHRVLWAGRTGDPHAASTFPGMLDIEPANVLAQLAALDRLP